MPVVGHDHHARIARLRVLDQITHAAIQMVEAIGGQFRPCRITAGGLGIEVFPRLVLKVVHQFIQHHHDIPAVLLTTMERQLNAAREALLDGIDVRAKYAEVAGGVVIPLGLEGEIRPTVQNVGFEIARVCEFRVCAGRAESGYQKAVHSLRRIGHGYEQAADPQAGITENLPDRAIAHEVGAVESQFVRADVVALEIENAVLSRPFAGHEGGPGGGRDGRNRGHQHAGGAAFDHAFEVRHPALIHHGTQDIEGRSIQSDQQHAMTEGGQRPLGGSMPPFWIKGCRLL